MGYIFALPFCPILGAEYRVSFQVAGDARTGDSRRVPSAAMCVRAAHVHRGLCAPEGANLNREILR